MKKSKYSTLNAIFIILLFAISNSCKKNNIDPNKVFTFLGDESPQVLVAFPGMGDKNLPRNQSISVLFNQPMNINSCIQSFTVSPQVQGFFEFTDISLKFTPTNQLNFGSYTYNITKNCESSKGGDLKELFSASFTVGEATQAGQFPEVIAINVNTGTIATCNTNSGPRRNIISDSVNDACMGSPNVNPIEVIFSKPMDRVSVQNGISLSPSVPFNLQWISDSIVQINPDIAFTARSRISVQLTSTIQDTNGVRLLSPISSSFYVGTLNLVPTLTSIQLATGTLGDCLSGIGIQNDIILTSVVNGCLGNSVNNPITIQFSRPMSQAQTIAGFSISPNVTGTFLWSGGDQTLTFTPDSKFTFGQRYTITISTIAISSDRVAFDQNTSYSFVAGGALTNSPIVQAIGVASQGCSNTFPGVGQAAGGNWLAANCFWDSTLPVLGPNSYQFRGGDNGDGTNANCTDVNTDNFRLIFSNYMNITATINAIRLQRTSPPGTIIQLASWNWTDCQLVYPFGCRVVTLAFSELESSCNGTSFFGNAGTGGDFNLSRTDNMPAGYPYYMLTVDTSARDTNNLQLGSTFQFVMEGK
ncbi:MULTISPECIES: Ig-like domain-containing protein [Leptospira]|uniref:Ig-like domain-containing protein n=1 Tax=Leptospira limi TaxID=2950023 RepID=A0ABT3M220_9LEPT|nr:MULTISPECIES: Ig-like domain-containing protein [Leptospira]MCW7464020.1 Ig-like domain-containing protein [Leptospira limi]TGK92485.1 hypothetical protein EHQ34_17865 [Leptospira levettii]